MSSTGQLAYFFRVCRMEGKTVATNDSNNSCVHAQLTSLFTPKQKTTKEPYGSNKENNDEGIGDLAPEDLVPLDTSVTLELVDTIDLESVSSLLGGQTFEGVGRVMLGSLVDCEGVEGCFGFIADHFFLCHVGLLELGGWEGACWCGAAIDDVDVG